MNNFLYKQVREVEKDPFRLDLWARGHGKSLIKTYAFTIQTIIRNPEETTCIISYNLKSAKAFLREIKFELEINPILKLCFPDILYQDPKKESPKWSEDDGIIIKRKRNKKEATVEAFGLVDSQAIGKHYDHLCYDDVVIPESVQTDDALRKTTERWELSSFLGMSGGSKESTRRYQGTRYHYFDTYKTMIDRNIPCRVVPATDDGTRDGNPVFLTRDKLDKFIRENGLYSFSSQMLLNPVSKEDQKLKRENIRFYDKLPDNLRIYVLFDPANSTKKKSDFTAGLVLGFSGNSNIYLIDGIHDKVGLQDRWEIVKYFKEKHKPFMIGYEKFGMQVDIDHFNIKMRDEGRYIEIIELDKSLSGGNSKFDRIMRLEGSLSSGMLYFPRELKYTRKVSGEQVDITQEIIKEMEAFPFGEHDDLLDCLSRIYDATLIKPYKNNKNIIKPNTFAYEMEKRRKERLKEEEDW